MICIPIMARNNAEALEKMCEASTLADMMEIRLDVMESFGLGELLKAAPKPVLVTYRSRREGGEGSADYGTRVRHLTRAVEAGADLVDVEFGMPLEFRREVFQNKGSSKLVLSAHLLNGTPPKKGLEDIFRKMAATGADIIKIVTLARGWEDNFRVLELIPSARAIGTDIIAFCMGPFGRISRIASLLMGAHMTFASLESGDESAPGQIPIQDMRRILEMLSP